MYRLTRVLNDSTVIYMGDHKQYETGDLPAEVNIAGVRDVLTQLATYENTGRTPDEVKDLMWHSSNEIPKLHVSSVNVDDETFMDVEVSEWVLAVDIVGNAQKVRYEAGPLFAGWCGESGKMYQNFHWIYLPPSMRRQENENDYCHL